MPSLADLKRKAKAAYKKRQKARKNRKDVEMKLMRAENTEQAADEKFKKALAKYEAKAGPDASDLGSSSETI
jgi:hypothetical protein